ncbi:metallophosphoesterase [Photobacterium toruni]|uniref:Metallophosphoesterase n=1 Tax=Photobacterium toruni TaxID=1935446 RepID=A0ABU6L8T2_9GAMM|nr:metallophosphoesterase [Photobacterium toruni]
MFKKTTIATVFNADMYNKLFFVGDLHGERELLESELDKIGFDKEHDLLVGVGDLIDRGTDSLWTLELINEPWFKSVRGNHEQMAIDAVCDLGYDHRERGNRKGHWMNEGGIWFWQLAPEQRAFAKRLINQCQQLPLILELHRHGKKIVVCHADYPLNEYVTSQPVPEINILCSRKRIRAIRGGDNESIIINGADLFVFGHTSLRKPLIIGNICYIDTGAVFSNKLTIIEASAI